jgi:hypothetical protein
MKKKSYSAAWSVIAIWTAVSADAQGNPAWLLREGYREIGTEGLTLLHGNEIVIQS